MFVPPAGFSKLDGLLFLRMPLVDDDNEFEERFFPCIEVRDEEISEDDDDDAPVPLETSISMGSKLVPSGSSLIS